MRRLLEVGVVLIVAVVITRVFIAEAYIVPTGSMAPALAGNHKSTTCPCCGFPIMVGHQGYNPLDGGSEEEREARRHYQDACCPNCGWEQLHLEQVAECPGDRLLVHKHLFEVRPPRRWEMVVFRNPQVERNYLADTYIKRVVGLPGERLFISDGDVYINGEIARKTLGEFRAMRLPVFVNDYQPRDGDKQPRWFGWDRQSRWQPEDGGRRFHIDARATKADFDWLCYRHLVRDREDGKVHWLEDDIKDVAGYNGGHVQERRVHDLLLDADLRCKGAGWLAVAVTDGHDDVLIEIPLGLTGMATVRNVSANRRFSDKPPPPVVSLSCQINVDQPLHLEAGLVDRRLLLALNGKEIFGNIDLPTVLPARDRHGLRGPLALGGAGPVSLGVYGLEADVMHLRLFRDIHYTERNGRSVYPNAITKVVELQAGEFFMLGDNSANSYDSRCWQSPVVREEYLVGKAFLVHLPTRLLEWQQFGEPRAMAVPDWSRMRLLP